MNFITQIAHKASRNVAAGHNFLFRSLHSWKPDWCQNKMYGVSKAE